MWAAYWLSRYSLGFESGLHEVYGQAVARLEGQAEAEMRDRVDRWFADEVAHRLRPGAASALSQHREAGDHLVVATTSSPYAAGAARRTFGLDDQISTRFEVVDGRFTGEVSQWALGADKAARVREYAAREGIDLGNSVAYTDSISDLALLEAVGEPVAVNPDRALAVEARRRGWTVVDWGTR